MHNMLIGKKSERIVDFNLKPNMQLFSFIIGRAGWYANHDAIALAHHT